MQIYQSMASILRFRKLYFLVPSHNDSKEKGEKEQLFEAPKVENPAVLKKQHTKKKGGREWRCIDSCCWTIGCLCTTWWLLLFLYNCWPANLTGVEAPEPPGARLKRHGLTAHHPVVLVPGIITGGLELWEGRPCSEGLFRKRLWGGTFGEMFRRYD